MFLHQTDPVIKLRALWSLYAIGAADQKFLQSQLAAPDEHVRAWAVRLLTDSWALDTVLSKRPSGRAGETPAPLHGRGASAAQSAAATAARYTI